jgi:hypothetical protein
LELTEVSGDIESKFKDETVAFNIEFASDPYKHPVRVRVIVLTRDTGGAWEITGVFTNDDAPDHSFPEPTIGYITNFNATTRTFDFDTVRWLSTPDNDGELTELGVNPGSLANGYYIYNPDTASFSVTAAQNCKFYISLEAQSAEVSYEEFVQGLDKYGDWRPIYNVEFLDDEAVVIMERYQP